MKINEAGSATVLFLTLVTDQLICELYCKKIFYILFIKVGGGIA